MPRVLVVFSLLWCALAGCVPHPAPHPAPRPSDPEPSVTSPPAQPPSPLGLAGEWEPTERLLIGWADQTDDLVPFFADVIAAAVREVEVTLLISGNVNLSPLYAELAASGVDSKRVRVEPAALDTMWIRDYGPLVVRTPTGQQVMDFAYSEERPADDGLPGLMARSWGLPLKALPFDLEGGHIQADGAGRCIVSDSVFPESSEISPMAQSELWEDLGCFELSTVPGLIDEETGHLDMFAYITGPGNVIVGRYAPGEDDENAARLDESALRLQDAGFRVRRVPMPGNSSRQIFRTYTNALALNNVVLVPVYDEDSNFEDKALATFGEAFPGRRIIPIPSDQIIQLAGAVHCVTMTSVTRVGG